jgi:hypothetical protein
MAAQRHNRHPSRSVQLASRAKASGGIVAVGVRHYSLVIVPGRSAVRFQAKSIVQTVLLLILLIAGGGLFLWQQDSLGFLTGLWGDTPTPAPTRVAIPAAAPKPKEEKIVIPAEPAKGQIQGEPFHVETADIEAGVLTLRQADTEVKLFLRTNPWEVPAGRSFQILSANAAAVNAPLVRVRWREAGQDAPRQREFKEKYVLKLELGLEQERRVSGKIYLVLPDENKSQLAGTFGAEVRGFRLVDGKPDLTSDSVDTLQYLALREVLKDDPEKPVKDVAFRHARYSRASADAPPTGYLELDYRQDDVGVTKKFQFVKENNAWRVVATLRPHELDEAHPYKAPAAKDGPERLFSYLAASRIEADMQKRHPGKRVSASEFATRYSAKHKIGVSEVSYTVGEDQAVQTAFLFRLGANGWSLARELNKKERVNLASGKVETQR